VTIEEKRLGARVRTWAHVRVTRGSKYGREGIVKGFIMPTANDQTIVELFAPNGELSGELHNCPSAWLAVTLEPPPAHCHICGLGPGEWFACDHPACGHLVTQGKNFSAAQAVAVGPSDPCQ